MVAGFNSGFTIFNPLFILPNLAEKASLMLMGGDESAGLIFS